MLMMLMLCSFILIIYFLFINSGLPDFVTENHKLQLISKSLFHVDKYWVY